MGESEDRNTVVIFNKFVLFILTRSAYFSVQFPVNVDGVNLPDNVFRLAAVLGAILLSTIFALITSGTPRFLRKKNSRTPNTASKETTTVTQSHQRNVESSRTFEDLSDLRSKLQKRLEKLIASGQNIRFISERIKWRLENLETMHSITDTYLHMINNMKIHSSQHKDLITQKYSQKSSAFCEDVSTGQGRSLNMRQVTTVTKLTVSPRENIFGTEGQKPYKEKSTALRKACYPGKEIAPQPKKNTLGCSSKKTASLCRRQAKLPTTPLRQAKLPTTSLRQAKLPTTSLRQAKLPTTSLRQAKLPTTSLRQAKLPTTSLR